MDEFLMPAEVAALFGVTTKSVMRWADEGTIRCVRTLGGHRRYPVTEVLKLLEFVESGRFIAPRDHRLDREKANELRQRGSAAAV